MLSMVVMEAALPPFGYRSHHHQWYVCPTDVVQVVSSDMETEHPEPPQKLTPKKVSRWSFYVVHGRRAGASTTFAILDQSS